MPRRPRRKDRRWRKIRALNRAKEAAALERQALQQARREHLESRRILTLASVPKRRDREVEDAEEEERRTPRPRNRVKAITRKQNVERYYRNLRHTDQTRPKPVRVARVCGLRYL